MEVGGSTKEPALSTLEHLLEWLVSIERSEVEAAAAALRRARPEDSNRELAMRIFTIARWKATAAGALTGLPSTLLVSGGAAVVDVGTVLRVEAQAAARVAVICEPTFFTEEDAKWEILVPVFGLDIASQIAREAGVRAGVAMTRQMIRAYLSKSTLQAFKRIALKYLGIKITQRAVITKTVPVIGGVIGGVWNFGELTFLRERCIKYFAGDAVGTTTTR